MITIKQLIDELRKYLLVLESSSDEQCLNMKIESLSYNSKEIATNTLFICKGISFKAEYLTQAVQNGAVAYIAENKFDEIPDNIAFIRVSDVRRAMSIISITFYDYAYKDLNIVGITGTKGKTTTAYFIKNIIDEYIKSQSAILSTIEIFTGGETEEAHLTTPESLDLHRHINNAKQNGIKYLTMEVSSQAYKMSRVFGMSFNIGLFLNLDDDHISPVEHVDFEDYFSCKLEFIKNCETAIIYGHTREFKKVLQTANDHCKKIITYGLDEKQDYYADNIQKIGNGFTFDVIANGYNASFKINMLGRFNVENALAAIVTAKLLGIDDNAIRKGLANTSVKGRMKVFENKGVTVIVDYAHNFLSFSKLYESIKADFAGSKIISVFGCPGGKANSRRKDLGMLAGQNAQLVYLTADDPQYEDANDICNELASYIKPYGVPYEIITDRKAAIEKAITTAKAGDVIILAAKGEEPFMRIRGEYVPYESDLVLAQQFLGI